MVENKIIECFFFFNTCYWNKCYIDKQLTQELDPLEVAGGSNTKFGSSCSSATAGFCLSQPSHYGGRRKTTRNWIWRVRQKVQQHFKHLISFVQINTEQKWWLIYKFKRSVYMLLKLAVLIDMPLVSPPLSLLNGWNMSLTTGYC